VTLASSEDARWGHEGGDDGAESSGSCAGGVTTTPRRPVSRGARTRPTLRTNAKCRSHPKHVAPSRILYLDIAETRLFDRSGVRTKIRGDREPPLCLALRRMRGVSHDPHRISVPGMRLELNHGIRTKFTMRRGSPPPSPSSDGPSLSRTASRGVTIEGVVARTDGRRRLAMPHRDDSSQARPAGACGRRMERR